MIDPQRIETIVLAARAMRDGLRTYDDQTRKAGRPFFHIINLLISFRVIENK